jgi:FkbM family methyltransferase
MSLSAFLYRRLSRWVTCELALPRVGKISLRSKHDVSSLADVFCQPFYWQLFHWLNSPPRLVVDCGANCGHFTMLAEMCSRARFGSGAERYLLVEPNPFVLRPLQRNLLDAGLSGRADVHQGLLGTAGEARSLWIHPANYLATGLTPQHGSRPYLVSGLRLRELVGKSAIDVLKIDIEGAEFSLVEDEPDVFARTALVCLEVHTSDESQRSRLQASLRSAGLIRQVCLTDDDTRQLWWLNRAESVAMEDASHA